MRQKCSTVLKEVGVELSSYHGGSLNGKDIKKVMNNACHIFDTFLIIFKGGEEAKLCAVGSCSLERCLFYGMGYFFH